MWSRRGAWDAGRWPERADRPRVLVEDPDGAVLDVSRRALTARGFDVEVCSGPRGMGRKQCPLLRGEGCRLAAGADVVYTSLAACGAEGRDVVGALRRRYPSTPVVAEVPQPREEELAGVLAGCRVEHMPTGREQLVAAVTAVLPAREPDTF